jgi:ent-kaurene oxidase
MFPAWMHPFVSRCLPSYWSGKNHVKSAKEILGPQFRELIRKSDEGSWCPEATEEDFHVLAWLADIAKGNDRNPETLAHVEVLLALASVHTTVLRMVNVLYDIIAHPKYWKILRDEIEAVEEKYAGEWTETSYQRLHKLDSVLRESQRLSPPTILGLKRVFKESYKFANGLRVPKGTYVALPITAIENDPEHTVSPGIFDGLRSYRLFLSSDMDDENTEEVEQITKRKGLASGNHQFSSLERTVLNFGYGRSACPGRHFASLIIKMTIVRLLTEFDFDFLPNSKRPRNYMIHEFLFPWPWEKVLIKRRTN